MKKIFKTLGIGLLIAAVSAGTTLAVLRLNDKLKITNYELTNFARKITTKNPYTQDFFQNNRLYIVK